MPIHINQMEYYRPPKPSPKPEDYSEFYTSLSDKEKQLLIIAEEKLGSSFFIQWCHMYKNFQKKKAEAQKTKDNKSE